MTVEDVGGALRRRWPVLLVGLLLAFATVLGVSLTPGVYWAVTKMYFLVPSPQMQPNPMAPENSRTIAFAGLIQTQMNDGVVQREAVSPDVTLVDAGIYDGWSVLLPNTGGQWATNFADPYLIVQASGPTPEVVASRMDDLISQVKQLTTEREDAAGVAATLRVNFLLSPSTAVVQYSNGHRMRAFAIIMVLGITVSVAGCVIADRLVDAFYNTHPTVDGTDDSIGEARLRDAPRGDQDGFDRAGTSASPTIASDRHGDGTAQGDVGSGQSGFRDSSGV